jgi:hypothetical protein
MLGFETKRCRCGLTGEQPLSHEINTRPALIICRLEMASRWHSKK